MSELGEILLRERRRRGLSLRAVERETDIQNAHLSQIEHGAIARPEPHVLWILANFYQLDFRRLMRIAGHIRPSGGPRKSLRAVAFRALDELSPGEQAEVVRYIDQVLKRREEGDERPD